MSGVSPILKLKQQVRFTSAGKKILALICGVGLMTLSAKIQLPFWPVPMTLHTLCVMGIAVGLGPAAGVAVMGAYLMTGALGVPVFSASPMRGIGLAYMMGPTGGYLFGYLIAAGLVGKLAAERRMLGQIGAMLAGLAVIYAFGLLWLSLFTPASQLLALGVAPFLLGDLLKIAVVAVGAAALSGSSLAARIKTLSGF